jgi:hypothetical protein
MVVYIQPMTRIACLLLLTPVIALPPLGAEAPPPPGSTDAVPRFAAREESSGEREMKALALAYPGRIAEVARRDGDWALRIDQTWYYWSRGRLLPAELRERWNDFASYRFYSYPLLFLPPLPTLDEEDRRQLKERLERSDADPPRRHEAFLGQLYRAGNREQTEKRIATVSFLGFRLSIHEDVLPALRGVERRLRRRAQADPEVRRFLDSLRGVAGYNWRPIAGQRSRSYHSYGIAVDLMPKSYRGLHTYWRWAVPDNERWYAIPYGQRWMVPEAVVQAFEEEGFVWGGKWFFFDTMHFEYRPEILILARQRQGPSGSL